MKKVFFVLIFLFLIAILGGIFLWSKKTAVISHILSNHLKTSVSIKEINFSSGKCTIFDLLIHNKPPCKTPNALEVKEITTKATLQSVLQKTLEIESLYFKDISLGVEFLSSSQDQNNWTLLLEGTTPNKKKSRPYLIHSLFFDQIHVTVTDIDGKSRKVTIGHLEFHNISDQSGFPIEEIEKAIFQAMMESVFKELGIKVLKKMIDSSVPKLFRIPFISQNG